MELIVGNLDSLQLKLAFMVGNLDSLFQNLAFIVGNLDSLLQNLALMAGRMDTKIWNIMVIVEGLYVNILKNMLALMIFFVILDCDIHTLYIIVTKT